MAEAEAQISEEDVEVTFDDEAPKVQSQTEVPDTTETRDTPDTSETELDDYGKGVQKRIKKLTEKYRYAERDKEEAARVAKVLKEENESLNARLRSLEEGHLNEYGTRLESQLAQANAALKDAHERGDMDAVSQATLALGKLAVEQERHRVAKQRTQPVAQEVQQPVQQQPVQQPQQQEVQPNPKAKKWAEKNEWFGEDEILTQAAYVIDKQLISEGFDGTEDEYYTELDNRLKKRFPNDLGGNERSARVASASTSASRSTTQGRRTVKLTPSQVAIAKKLGVPLEEYAKYVKD